MNHTKFIDGDQPYYAFLEEAEEPNSYRIIIFERDEDSGARCVCDIIDTPIKLLHKWLVEICERHRIDPKSDIKLPSPVDIGKATTVNGITKKIAESFAPNDEADAKRWRALIGAGRLRWVGSAGFEHNSMTVSELTKAVVRNEGEYLHFGMEFWDTYEAEGLKKGNNHAISVITAFADELVRRNE